MKFSTSIRIILPAHRGLHVPLLLLWDHLHLLQQYEPRAQRGTSPPIRSMATVHTPHLPHLEKDSLLISLQHQVQMFGQLSCSISNDHLDLTVLAEKKAARASSLERLSFLGRKCLFTFSPCSEHRVLSLRAQPQSSEGCP